MPKAKIAVSLDQSVLKRLDRVVDAKVYRSRSQAVEAAIEESLNRLDSGRLARECAKLDPAFEKALSEEGFGQDSRAWPEY